ncbi:DUF2829 domain-containing protein [Aeromonas veronii]|uniref:DUF2829 domain-containing protein n=1 Tax=Aeromonas veronii TaxID=654 RepID=UPI00222F3C84|nr:DUF2829 domain-containing protein [Aeromonas veronii]UZE61027.1 DUF2829 domain-containing protein [Aeromonas veronii]
MNFGFALESLSRGMAVARKGWNGSGLKVRLQSPDERSKMSLPYLYIEYPLDAKTTPGARCPWLPSATDLMADDWYSEAESPKPSHIERMRMEQEQLAERTGKLETFIPSETFKQLPHQEQNRMKRQLVAMREYLAVLNERVGALGSCQQ